MDCVTMSWLSEQKCRMCDKLFDADAKVCPRCGAEVYTGFESAVARKTEDGYYRASGVRKGKG